MYGWVRQYGLVGRSVHAIGARSCVVGARSRYFSGWSKINSDMVGNVYYVMMLITRSSVCLYIVLNVCLRTFYHLHRFCLKPSASW